MQQYLDVLVLHTSLRHRPEPKLTSNDKHNRKIGRISEGEKSFEKKRVKKGDRQKGLNI